MANLRILEIKHYESDTIKVRFSEELDSRINSSNISITSLTESIPDCKIISVDVISDYLIIYTLPITPLATYKIEFKSSNSSKFKSINNSFLIEDGNSNSKLIVGAESPDNNIRDRLLSYLSQGPYSLDPGTVVRTANDHLGQLISRFIYDIGQLKNDNYLSHTVKDEKKVRGNGPFDRLNEEGSYELIRVGKEPTGNYVTKSISFSSFPSKPISLQQQTVTEEVLIAGSSSGTFDGLILNLRKKPVLKVHSIIINYNDGNKYKYPISSKGYQLKNNKYDKFASSYLLLEDNQVKLNDSVLEDSNFKLPSAIDKIVVSYDYKNLGIFIDPESINVSELLTSTRETVEPLVVSFFTNHCPIVNDEDIISKTGGILFLDPLANPPFSSTHPAFIKEVPLQLDALPFKAGDYAVNYETGQVFVFGEENKDGTGNYPPIISYNYRNKYSSKIDFTYDPETCELVGNPNRDIIGKNIKITFNYELVLVDGFDFKSQTHQESLNERINNKVYSNGSLKVSNWPVTNVFRIYNETTGEVYSSRNYINDTIYFDYKKPLNFSNIVRERVNFKNIYDELLLVSSIIQNNNNIKIFKIKLKNDIIGSNTEDCIGSSFNTSVLFSRKDLFNQEIYFDNQTGTELVNIDLLSIGDYQIDYFSGIIYLGVSDTQDYDLGNINYKSINISTKNKHIIGVNEVYTSLGISNSISQRFEVLNFKDDYVVFDLINRSDERFNVQDEMNPYYFDSGNISLSYDAKEIRNIFDHYDLINNNNPINFANSNVSISGSKLTLGQGPEKKETLIISDEITLEAKFLSNGIEIQNILSIRRVSDNSELSASDISGYTIILDSNVNSPLSGEEVEVIYNLTLNASSTPIIDYDHGELFIDYTYLNDEILVSYEYGDNCLDFRESETVSPGETYYVTYKVGALRDALLKNFGSLINIPALNHFDNSMVRERYRDALSAALQSFTKGPTKASIENLVSKITHIKPEINESIFKVWSLGASYLYSNTILVNGDINIVPGKFDYGMLIEKPDENVIFPISGNLKLEEGTLETFVTPQWFGLDNDATLTFKLFCDSNILNPNQIYIGSKGYHPTYNITNSFSLNKNDLENPTGIPYQISDNYSSGVFIYFDEDNKVWKLLAKDSLNKSYTGNIVSSGEIYNAKLIPGLADISDYIRSGLKEINFKLNIDNYDFMYPDGYADGYADGYVDGYGYVYGYTDGYVQGFSFDGLQFMADEEHYLFDFGDADKNRFSIFKDGSGYLNFLIKDRHGNNRRLSVDISSWRSGQTHHIATSWKINTFDEKDEMHLFIDGFEAPNIIKYGGRPETYVDEKFRSVKSEIILGSLSKSMLFGVDLHTQAGSSIVYSDSVNFNIKGIIPGDTIKIRESGFNEYTITSVSENYLTLDANMPGSLTDARFSVNEFSSIVSSEINLYSNIAVYLLRSGEEIELPGVRARFPGYEISKNMLNQDILTIIGNAEIGDRIVIRTFGINHKRCRDRQFIWGNNSSIFKTSLPSPINLDEVNIKKILLPMTNLNSDNSSYVGPALVSSNIQTSQPSNIIEGRTLAVRINGNNVDFSTPTEITINGITNGLATSEILSFVNPGTQYTINKFLNISGVDVTTYTIAANKPGISFEISEKYSITYSEGNENYPVIRFSYKTQTGKGLFGSGLNIVSDQSGYFLNSNVGQKLVIKTPLSVAGTYLITEKINDTSIGLDPPPPINFSNGTYDIFNTSLGRSGFQNGFWTIETAGQVNTPYLLTEGLYEFDYSVYLNIPFDPISRCDAYIGSDIFGKKQAKVIFDEFIIWSKQLTDTRVGEIVEDNDFSITSSSLRIIPQEKNKNILVLLDFNQLPLINNSDYWIAATSDYLQSDTSVNSNFEKSLLITDKPFVLDNFGLLQTNSEGTIEFWVSPKYDTYNDPTIRFYFDATSAVYENLTSSTASSITLVGKASKIVGIYLQNDSNNLNNLIEGSVLSNDSQTIRLNQPLPYQQTPVRIYYIPNGISQGRISIYKDPYGYINFSVFTQGQTFEVKQPIFWSKNTWHRIQATYKFNKLNNQDEIRLFIDGEEKGTVKFGQGFLFGEGVVFGQNFAGVNKARLVADINFIDPINQIYIGSNYLNSSTSFARIDNLRLSNISRSPTVIAYQDTDINFSSNLSLVYPVVSDAFTTYLMDFNTLFQKNTDFSILIDEKYGIFNFDLNILDSFGILSSDLRLKQILETLIKILKPADNKANIIYG